MHPSERRGDKRDAVLNIPITDFKSRRITKQIATESGGDVFSIGILLYGSPSALVIGLAAAYAVGRVRNERPGRLEGRFAELERERLAREQPAVVIEREGVPADANLTRITRAVSSGSSH